MTQYLSYCLIRVLTFPFAFLPYRMIHILGNCLGSLAYHFLTNFRKRALSNLALAKDLHLTNKEIRQIAKASFQNVMITCLEYPKLARETTISKIALCENSEKATALMQLGKGVIFFCGHLANWELLFLEGTSRMPGVAIGRPIKNRYLYAWILQMRQKFGGKIVSPKNGIKEGLLALKKGSFFGIVGDQGMPDSGYCSSFLGRLAWTSPMPALLAYKTGTPLIVATTRRKEGKYHITYSDPIYPDPTAPKEQEVSRLMDTALLLFQEEIKKCPEQWLWIHNRWKQQTLDKLQKPYRQDSLAIFLPDNRQLVKEVSLFREFYPREHITLFVPEQLAAAVDLEAEIIPYTQLQDLLQDDLRFKLIFNCTGNRAIDRHYKKRTALHVVHLTTLSKNLETLIRNA